MINFILAAAALSRLGAAHPPERATKGADASGNVGVIPAPDDRALPDYDGGHRTTAAPKGRRLTRAQRKALNARRGCK